MERLRYIRVPKDKKAMEDYDYGVQKEEQMEELVLSEESFDKLWELGVFEQINEACDVLIDDYEEEVLKLEKIPTALGVVTRLNEENKTEELIRLRQMLIRAMENQTIVGFDF